MSTLEDFGLFPEEVVSVDDAIAAGAASLEDTPLDAVSVPEPFGRTPLFNFETGRFAQKGGDLLYVSGHDALRQWCLMVTYSARYAHSVFSDDFGLEDPDAVLGQAADVMEAASDWGERLRDALLVHDRIAAVEDFNANYSPTDQALYVDFTVVTDEAEELDFDAVSVPVGID